MVGLKEVLKFTYCASDQGSTGSVVLNDEPDNEGCGDKEEHTAYNGVDSLLKVDSSNSMCKKIGLICNS